jgi:hypothetical protein
MNKIEIKKNKSDYAIYDIPFNDIMIDGVFLDKLLDDIFPGKNIKELVPPFSGWLINKNDEEILWKRIIPKNNEPTILPILICPDDQDYSCSTLVAKVKKENNSIYWQKFGFDKSSAEFNKPENIGLKVEWFEDKITFEFNYNEYSDVFKFLKSEK